MPQRATRTISGRQVLVALLGIAFATAIIPPAAAWGLNQRRIVDTLEGSRAAVAHVAAGVALLGPEEGPAVVRGPGRLPESRDDLPSSVHEAWISAAAPAPALFGAAMPTDAWGHCFFVNAGASGMGGTVWLLSAGPNGVIETPLGASALAGDDIGVAIK
ncbi:MAG: hypothetical protein HQ485_00545 [Acidobacteria bacterium]|nr:hypothetical protein [Acidobacteriota bacterium]